MVRLLRLGLQPIGILMFLGTVTSGCGSGCDFSAGGLTVEVFDAVSGERICGASIIAVDGSYSKTMFEEPGPYCWYAGPYERAGTYTITAQKDGYLPSTSSATLRSDECGVRPVLVTVHLTRRS